MQTSLRSSYQSYYDYASCGLQEAPGATGPDQFGSGVARAFILADHQQLPSLAGRLDNNATSLDSTETKYNQIERFQEQPGSYELSSPSTDEAAVAAVTCYAPPNQLYQTHDAHHLHHHHHHHHLHQQSYTPVSEPQQRLEDRREVPEYQPEYNLQEQQHTYQTLYYEPVHFNNNNNNNNNACHQSHQPTSHFLNQQFVVAQQQEYIQYESCQPASLAGNQSHEDYGQQQCLQQATVYQALGQHQHDCQNNIPPSVKDGQVPVPEVEAEIVKRVGESQHYHQLSADSGHQYHLLTGMGSSAGTTVVSADDELDYSARHSLAGSPICSEVSDEQSQFSSAGDSASTAGSSSTLTRDEKRARCANIPLTYNEIVNLSIDQFNDQLAKHKLTESQLTLIKDIRRRGKNKVAAQSCRKRKMEQIYELQQEVGQLMARRRLLAAERAQLIKEQAVLIEEYDKIYSLVQDKMQPEGI